MTDSENTMVLETTKGNVVIRMRPDLAPQHVTRIKELVREGFYDGITFHRVIDGFMAQTGCPHGTGTGGSGRNLKAEFNPEPHRRGTVSMARAQNPLRRQSVLHLLRRCIFPGRPIYGLGRGNGRNGKRRPDKARRTGAKSRSDHHRSDFGRRGVIQAGTADCCAGGSSVSHTQAFWANHSCCFRQSGQWTRAKNTGIARKLSRSATMPVEMARPVSGHLIMTEPILASFGQGRR